MNNKLATVIEWIGVIGIIVGTLVYYYWQQLVTWWDKVKRFFDKLLISRN